MGLKIGGTIAKLEKRLEGDLKKAGKELQRETAVVAADAKKAWGAAGKLASKVKDGFLDVGAEAVGVAELTGFRYKVKPYQSKVSDTLTRGSRIDNAAGYDALKKEGFKSIVDLTLEGTKDAKLAPNAGLKTLNVRILDNEAPTTAQMKQFLDFATNPKNTPCYVHCEAGQGRTGVAVVCYRMAVEGWPADKAIDEGKKFGLKLSDHMEFIQQFSAQLKAGEVAGYPKQG